MVIAVFLFFLLRTGPKNYSNHVVVVEFYNQTGDPNIDRVSRQAAQEVSQGLESLGLFGVAPLTRFDLGSNRSLEEKAFLQIAKNADAAIVVVGECYYQATNLEIRSKIYDARKKRLIPAPDAVSGPMEDTSEVLNELNGRMKSAVLQTHAPRVE